MCAKARIGALASPRVNAHIGTLLRTLVMVAWKVRPYFLKHPIEIIINFSLSQTLQKPDISGWMVKWAVELEQFNIRYKPCSSIKGQTLAHFMAEFSIKSLVGPPQDVPWDLFVDGSSIGDRSGIGVVLISPNRHLFCEALPFDFRTFNNEAE